MTKVAIVILNWNGSAMLQKFLPTLIKHSSTDGVYQITEPMHRLDISLRKTFLKDALSVELRGDDLFQAKDVVKMVTDIYTIDQSSIRDSRRFSFTLRYKFNSANSKYKGTGAGNLQKSRL